MRTALGRRRRWRGKANAEILHCGGGGGDKRRAEQSREHSLKQATEEREVKPTWIWISISKSILNFEFRFELSGIL